MGEPWGYHDTPGVDFYSKLDPNVEHGWPSFRPAEIVSENVIIHEGGRTESKCLTHLGHNLPMNGVDRYCIDLVCMAGTPPLSTGNEEDVVVVAMNQKKEEEAGTEEDETAATTTGDGIISASQFNASSYESSATNWSGKHPKTKQRIIISVSIVVPVLVLAAIGIFFRKKNATKEAAAAEAAEAKTASSDPEKQTPSKVGTNSDNDGSSL